MCVNVAVKEFGNFCELAHFPPLQSDEGLFVSCTAWKTTNTLSKRIT